MVSRRWIAAAALVFFLGGAVLYRGRHRLVSAVRFVKRTGAERALLAPVKAASIDLPPVAAYHPRILINRDLNLADLKSRARALKGEFDALKGIIDSDEMHRGKYCNVSENVSLTLVMSTAYLYQITGKTEYADRLIDSFFLGDCLDPQHDGTDNGAFDLEQGALIFDWTYDRIVARNLKHDAIEKLKRGYQTMASQPEFAHYIREADFHNYTVGFENAWLMTGLALAGEDPAAEAMLQRGWGTIATGFPFQPTTFGDTFQYHLKASIDMTGGAMNWEGPFYWRGAAPEIVRAIEAMDTATNRSRQLWSTAFSNLQNGGAYRLYLARPDGTLPGLGDGTAGQPPSWKDNFALAILFDRFKDGHLPRLMDNTEGGWYGGYGTGLIFKLMYYDNKIRPQAPTDLPTSREFGREAYLRSGWGAGDTYVTFTSGSLGYFHNHLDENGFTVFRGADLATDGGYSLASPYYQNYAKRTVAHNAITVYDPAECWRDTSAQCTLSNDGGQRWPLRRFNPPYTKEEYGINRLWSGSLLSDPFYREQFVTADRKTDFQPAYDFIDSDATRAYTNQWSGQGSNTNRRVALARRELIFVKPGWIAILDRVESTNAAFRKAWLLHSTGAPAVRVGGAWTAAAPGVKDLSGASEMMVRNGKASMLVKTLLPANPQVRTIGGPGYEGWVNGNNYWTPEMDKEPTVGKWRFEVSPSTPSEKDLFLHVLSVAAPGKEPEEAISRLNGGENATGAIVGQGAASAVVVFSRTPEAQRAYRYQAPSAALHVVADLAPGAYTVWRDDTKLTSVTVAAGKCLSFRAPGGGQFRIER